MPDTKVTLTWEEPLNHLLDDALKNVVKDHLLSDPDTAKLMKTAVIDTAGQLSAIAKEVVAGAMKEDLFKKLGDNNAALKAELNKVLADFQYFQKAHASDYAIRRFNEVTKRLEELSR